MGTGDLQRRLAALPGVLQCTVTDQTVTLVVHPEVDPRLLKARAQVACAELRESRPLVVVGGLAAAAGAGPIPGQRRGALAGVALARRATPLSIAVVSLFVFAAAALVPIGSGDRGGDGRSARREPPVSVAVEPPSSSPSGPSLVPPDAAELAARPGLGSPAPLPGPSVAPRRDATAGPAVVVTGLASGRAFGQRRAGTEPPALGTAGAGGGGIGTAAVATSVSPAPTREPQASGPASPAPAPAPAPAPEAGTARPAPAPTSPSAAPETSRTTAPQLLVSGTSTESEASSTTAGRGRDRRAGRGGGRASDGSSTRPTAPARREPEGRTSAPDPEEAAARPARAGQPERPHATAEPETVENQERPPKGHDRSVSPRNAQGKN